MGEDISYIYNILSQKNSKVNAMGEEGFVDKLNNDKVFYDKVYSWLNDNSLDVSPLLGLKKKAEPTPSPSSGGKLESSETTPIEEPKRESLLPSEFTPKKPLQQTSQAEMIQIGNKAQGISPKPIAETSFAGLPDTGNIPTPIPQDAGIDWYKKNRPDLIREDGTIKGKGYFGLLTNKDGGESTELSITTGGVEEGKESLIPTIVPTLNKEELDFVLSNKYDPKSRVGLSSQITNKAIDFARERKAKGLPFFATKEEEGKSQPMSDMSIFKKLDPMQEQQEKLQLGQLPSTQDSFTKSPFEFNPNAPMTEEQIKLKKRYEDIDILSNYEKSQKDYADADNVLTMKKNLFQNVDPNERKKYLEKEQSNYNKNKGLASYYNNLSKGVIDKEVEHIYKNHEGNQLTRWNELGVAVPDMGGIQRSVKKRLDELGLPSDGILYQRMKNELQGYAMYKLMEPKIQGEAEKIFIQETKKTMSQAAQKEYESFVSKIPEVTKIKTNAKLTIDAIQQDIASDSKKNGDIFGQMYKNSVAELQKKVSKDEEVNAYTENVWNSLLQEQQKLVDSGQKTVEQANAYLKSKEAKDIVSKEVGKFSDNKYGKDFVNIYEEYLNSMNALNRRAQNRFARQQDEVVRASNNEINKILEQKGKDFQYSPELKAKLKVAYAKAYKNLYDEKGELKENYQKVKEYNFSPFAISFIKPTFITSNISALGQTLAALGATFNDKTIEDLGERMDKKFYTPFEGIKEFADVLDPSKFSTGAGLFTGRMIPSILAAAGVGVVTRNAPAAVRMLSVGLARWGGETADMMGSMKREILEKTGDLALANQAATTVGKGQLVTLPFQIFEMDLLFGKTASKLFNKVPTLVGKATAAAASDFVGNYIEEIYQGGVEDAARAGKGARDSWKFVNAENSKALFYEMLPLAPMSIVGGIKAGVERQSIQNSVKNYIEKNGLLEKINGDNSNQYLANAYFMYGKDFTETMAGMLYQKGSINKEQLNKFDQHIQQYESFVELMKKTQLGERTFSQIVHNPFNFKTNEEKEQAKNFDKYANSIVSYRVYSEYQEAKKKVDEEKDPDAKVLLEQDLREKERQYKDFFAGKGANMAAVIFKDGTQYALTYDELNDVFDDEKTSLLFSLGAARVSLFNPPNNSTANLYGELQNKYSNLLKKQNERAESQGVGAQPTDANDGRPVGGEERVVPQDNVGGEQGDGVAEEIRFGTEPAEGGQAEPVGESLEVKLAELPTRTIEAEVVEEKPIAEATTTKEDEIKIGDMIDKMVNYKGEKGFLYIDGQRVIFKVDGKQKEYDLGNVEEVSDLPISQYDISHEESVVSINDDNNLEVRGVEYVNNYSNPTSAINYDKDGNVVSVNLETKDGKKRTFRGNIAEDIAYQIHLQEISKDNSTTQEFEQFINEDNEAKESIEDARLQETANQEAVGTDEKVSREEIKPSLTTTKNEQAETTKEDGKPLSEGVQGVRTETEERKTSAELRAEEEENVAEPAKAEETPKPKANPFKKAFESRTKQGKPSETEQKTTENKNAIQESETEGVLPRQQGEVRKTGSERQGVGQSKQGQETAQEGKSQKEIVPNGTQIKVEGSLTSAVTTYTYANGKWTFVDSKGKTNTETPKMNDALTQSFMSGDLDRVRTNDELKAMSAVNNIKQSLNSAGIEVKVIDNQAEFDKEAKKQKRAANQNIEGMFLSDDGVIYLNREKLSGEWGETIVFHEGIHPIVNILRNTNPKLLDRIMRGAEQFAKDNTNRNVASLFKFAEQYRMDIEKNDDGKYDVMDNGEVVATFDTEAEAKDFVDAKVKDEFITETFARITSGDIKLNELPSGFKQTLIELVNKILKALRMDINISALNEAEFNKYARLISNTLNEGRDIGEIVGAKNVGEYMNKMLSPEVIAEGKINKAAISQSRVTDEPAINVYEEKGIENIDTKTLDEIYDEYDGKAIVINSDTTRVGWLNLPSGKRIFMYGGAGYLSIKDNVDGNIGFATTQISKVETWGKYFKELFGDKKGVTLVATQTPKSMLSNSYALRYVMDAISTLPKSVLKSAEFKKEFFGSDLIALKDAFGEKSYNEFIKKYKNADLSNSEVIDNMISEMAYKVGNDNNPASFKARGAFVSNLLAGVDLKSKSKTIKEDVGYYSKNPQKYIAKELYDRFGLNQEKLFYELGEKSLVDLYMNEGKWGFIVSGFETNPDMDINSIQSKGVKHPLFNAKFPSSNAFLLDGAYEVNKLFKPIEQAAPKGGVYTKTAAQMLAGSMYVKGERVEGDKSFEYSKASPSGEKINAQFSKGSRGRKVYDETGFISVPNMIKIVESNNPDYLGDVMEHIMEMGEKLKNGGVNVSDLSKAYMMAVSSIRSGDINAETFENAIGQKVDEVFKEPNNKIRTEGAMAYLLTTDRGANFIKNIQLGKITDEDKRFISNSMKPFGMFGEGQSKYESLFGKTSEDQINLTNINQFKDLLKNGVKNTDELFDKIRRLKQISQGKVGFVSNFLGIGTRGVIDAREIQGWLRGSVFKGERTDAESEIEKQLNKSNKDLTTLQREILNRMREVGRALGIDENLAEYIGHHMIWDAVANERTTHDGLYLAMKQNQQEFDSRLRELSERNKQPVQFSSAERGDRAVKEEMPEDIETEVSEEERDSILQAVELYDSIKDPNKNAKQRKELKAELDNLLDENEDLKRIFANIKDINKQLQDKEIITKEGECP